MKTFSRLLFSFILYQLTFLPAQAQLEEQVPLSGIYTIGGESPDFGNFRAAIAALESQGITGPVTFKVRPGTYEEQLEIDPFPGSSCNHPVIFEGEGNSPAQVMLQSPEGSDITVQVNGADGIRFRNLSFVKKVEIRSGSDCFQFEENEISGSVQAISSATERNHQHSYRNNIFQSGGITIQNEAPWNPAAPLFDEGLIIEGNDFRGLGNIAIEGQRGFTISRNVLPELRQESNGISIVNSWFGEAVSKNSISVSTDDYKGTAVLLTNSAAAEITGNKISLIEGGVGLRVSAGQSTANEILVANNIIDVSGYDARGHNYFPISNLVGLDIENPFPNTVKIYHNDLKVSGYSESVPNYTLSVGGESNSFHILNNVIANGSSGTGVIVRGGAVASMDYNNLYMDYAKLFASYGGNPINSLAEWRNLTPFGTHSISVSPWRSHDPSETLKGAGIFVEEVPYDFYGQQRNNPPTIGAVESERTTAPLSGTYTIGGENPDFARFSDAIGALESSGAADTVLFKIRPGEYHEQLNLSFSPVQGAKVIFEGESGDSTDVVLNYPLDEVLVVQGARNYTFRYLTFASGIRLNNSQNLLFENNVIVGGVGASIVSNDTYLNNFFREKGISKAGEGVVREGGRYFFHTDGHVMISGNTFNVQDEAIDLYAQGNVDISHNRINLETDGTVPSAATAIRINSNVEIKAIKNNTIVSNLPNTIGISLDGIYFGGDLPKELTHNKIELQQGGTGISIGYSGSSSADCLIANNMISVNAIDQSTGISFSFIPGNIHIYSNNIALYGEGNNSRVLYFGGDIEKEIILYNNILANLAGGKVFVGDYFQNSPDKIAESNFNNLYTSGEVFAQWKEGAIPNRSAWLSATGFDSHSFSVDPEFESALSLIPNNAVLDGAGIALPGVETDFFGEIRSYPPDIGAVEFEPGVERPEPTPGFVIGGAVFHSPAGAITRDPMAEGRTILSFHADQKRGEERPKGIANLTIPSEGFRFKSVNAWEWMSVDEHTAIMEGTGELNREENYRFLISVADNGTGPGDPKDTYRMIIWDPDGEVVYDNQQELGLYAIASMPIERGNIMVGKGLRKNARLGKIPSVEGVSIQEFKAYPTILEENELWLEIPAHEFTGGGEFRLSILDRQGRVMTEDPISRAGKQRIKLNSGHWAPGVYLLIIRGGEQQFQQKLVKQK